jgi:hypothetical protein
MNNQDHMRQISPVCGAFFITYYKTIISNLTEGRLMLWKTARSCLSGRMHFAASQHSKQMNIAVFITIFASRVPRLACTACLASPA